MKTETETETETEITLSIEHPHVSITMVTNASAIDSMASTIAWLKLAPFDKADDQALAPLRELWAGYMEARAARRAAQEQGS
jgi:hypothetical protein